MTIKSRGATNAIANLPIFEEIREMRWWLPTTEVEYQIQSEYQKPSKIRAGQNICLQQLSRGWFFSTCRQHSVDFNGWFLFFLEDFLLKIDVFWIWIKILNENCPLRWNLFFQKKKSWADSFSNQPFRRWLILAHFCSVSSPKIKAVQRHCFAWSVDFEYELGRELKILRCLPKYAPDRRSPFLWRPPKCDIRVWIFPLYCGDYESALLRSTN